MNGRSWIITFADLSAVLCAFFVMMLAMSEFDAPALERIATIFGKDDGEWVRIEPASEAHAAVEREAVPDEGSAYLAAVLEQRFGAADAAWAVAHRGGAVVITRDIRDGGPLLSPETAAFLIALNQRIEIVGISPTAFDRGLRAASTVYARLHTGGGGDVTTSARLDRARPVPGVEIILSPPGGDPS